MFFRKTLDRIESKLYNIEYLVAEKRKMECNHPCTSVYIRPDNGYTRNGWVKVCHECNKKLDHYENERAYLEAKRRLMEEIIKADDKRLKELLPPKKP